MRAASSYSPLGTWRYMDWRPTLPGPVKRFMTRFIPASIPAESRCVVVSIFTPGVLVQPAARLDVLACAEGLLEHVPAAGRSI